jgi:hypothetical protein
MVTKWRCSAPCRATSTSGWWTAPARIAGGGVDVQPGRQYDVARDGRFLINTVLDATAVPITLLQNWHPEAKK